MAIELEKIKSWDGQSGTGADNRGVIDRNFDKVETELGAINTHVNTKFDDVEEEIIQLAGDVNLKAAHGYSELETVKTLKEIEDDTSVKMENLAVNGDFRNGLSGWIDGFRNQSNLSVSNNILSASVIEGYTPVNVGVYQSPTMGTADILYMSTMVSVSVNKPIILINDAVDYNLTPNVWTNISKRRSGQSTLRLYYKSEYATEIAKFTNAIVINLTETFGAGSEPTKEEMDLLISTLGIEYFEGEITIPAQKIMQWQLKNQAVLAQLSGYALDSLDLINKKIGNKIDSTLKNISKNVKLYTGRIYISENKGIGDILEPVYTISADNAILGNLINVTTGDTFIISGTSGIRARIYYILDNNNKILEIADENIEYTDYTIEIPENGVKIAFNITDEGYVRKLSKISSDEDILTKVAKIKTGVNLFNPYPIYRNSYINDDSLKITYPALMENARVTGYIPVEEGKTYTHNGVSRSIGFANIGDEEGVIPLLGKTFTIPIGSGIRYVRSIITSSLGDEAVESFMFNEGTTLLPFQPYEENGWVIKKDSLPSDVGEVSASDLEVEKLRISANYDSIQDIETNIQDILDALVDLETTSSGEVSIDIPTDGFTNEDLILKLHLHKGMQRGTPSFDEIFLGDNVKDDFSDIRFEDENGNNLDFNIFSTGNYDIIKDDSFGTNTEINSKGHVITSDKDDFGIKSSLDGLKLSLDGGNSWTTIDDELGLLVMVDSRDALYAMNKNTYKVYKFDLDGQTYINKREVLDLSISESTISQNLAVEDINGNIFFGKYQGAWDTEIFKSTDNGETFQSTYQTFNTQHIHHLNADKYTGWIYAGCDGSSGSSDRYQRLIVSKDEGLTWEEVPVPFGNSEYGASFSGNGYRIGNGEANVLGGATLYRTTDDVNFERVAEGMQGVQQVRQIGNRLIAGALASPGTRIAHILSSEDEGVSWNTIFAENLTETESIGDGYRHFSKPRTLAGESEEVIIIGGYYRGSIPQQKHKSLKFYNGGNNRHALVYVKVGNVPLEGKTIKLKYGYALKYPQRILQKDLSNKTSLKFRLKTDEGVGNIVRDSVSNEVFNLSGDHQWINDTYRYGTIQPYIKPYNNNGIKLNSSKININRPILKNESFSVIFWANLNRVASKQDKIIIGDPDGIHIYTNYFRVYLTDGINEFNSTLFWSQIETNHWGMYMITFDKDTLTMKTFFNDGGESKAKSEYVLTEWDVDKVNTKTLIDPSIIPIADMRVYNRVLSDKEYRAIYYGGEQKLL